MNDVNLLTNNGVNVSKSLELFGDMEMYDATLRDFLQLVDAKLANLKRYRETADLQNYANEVHSLKSDASYLGFTTLADLSYQFELKAKANDLLKSTLSNIDKCASKGLMKKNTCDRQKARLNKKVKEMN